MLINEEMKCNHIEMIGYFNFIILYVRINKKVEKV